MSKSDHFVGVVLIIVTAVAFIELAAGYWLGHPDAIGAFVAVWLLSSGVFAIRSIWRDRL